MARSLTELRDFLQAASELEDVYIQPPTSLTYPCIMVERSTARPQWADNKLYLLKKGYLLTVIARDSDSPVPDRIEELPYCHFDRFFRINGLNHFTFILFF